MKNKITFALIVLMLSANAYSQNITADNIQGSGGEGTIYNFKNLKGRSSDGILHIRSGNSTGPLFLNYYEGGVVSIANGGGAVSVGTGWPLALFDVCTTTENTLKSVLARLPEGNTTGLGTYLGIKSYSTQPNNVKSFSIEHSFYGTVNSSISFYRGGSVDGGFLTFSTSNNTERMRITAEGNVGIGTSQPNAALSIYSDQNWNGGWRNNLTLVSSDYPCIKFNSTIANKLSMVGNDGDGGLYFGVNCTSTTFGSYGMVILPNGNVGIGTLEPKGYKLAVAGRMIAEEVVIKTQATWPDFVFSPTYKLPTLSEVEQFVKTNQHLPEIPSAKEMQQEGVSVSEMQVKLLQKVEELTLYMIEQNRKLDELKKENELLKAENSNIKKEISAIKNH